MDRQSPTASATPTSTTTIEHDRALRDLEHAQRETPVCRVCGERTVPVAHADGSVWLECPSLAEREARPALRRLITLDFPGLHTRQLVVAARSAA